MLQFGSIEDATSLQNWWVAMTMRRRLVLGTTVLETREDVTRPTREKENPDMTQKGNSIQPVNGKHPPEEPRLDREKNSSTTTSTFPDQSIYPSTKNI